MDLNLISLLENSFKSNPLFQGGLILGIMTVIGSYLRPIPNKIYKWIKRKVVYSTVISEIDSDMFNEFETWLKNRHEKNYRNTKASIENDKVVTKQHIDTFFIRYKGKFLKIHKNMEKFENSGNIHNAFLNTYMIYGIFAKKKINKLLDEIFHDNFVLRKSSDVKHHFMGNDESYSIPWKAVCQLNRVKGKECIFVESFQEVIDDISDFKKNDRWYEERFMSFKRGYLFYGLPGNGKTSMSLAIGKYFKMDVYQVNLNRAGDRELINYFKTIKSNSILLIEDIDSSYNGRESISKSSNQFSFSTLLTCLDGTYCPKDVIIIFTTNHIEKLDPALIRAGRIDIKFEIMNPDRKAVEQYLSNFYRTEIDLGFETARQLCMAEIENSAVKNKLDHKLAIEDIRLKIEDKINAEEIQLHNRI